MADFLTRLAERTLGLVPVVQPFIAPEFASDPILNPPDSGWNAEANSSDASTNAPPTDAAAGRSEPPVVEPPEDSGYVASVAPEPGEQEAEVTSSPGTRRSSPLRPRPAEDIPDRTSTHPAEGEGGVDPHTGPPSATREPEKQAPDTSVGETRHAPDEPRSAEASAPVARASLSPRSVVDASQRERVAPDPTARSARVKTAEETLETQGTAKERPEEVTRTLSESQEPPSPTAQSRATRAMEITTVVPARPTRRPGQSDEPAQHTATRAEEPERRPSLPPGTTPEERESGPQVGASWPAPSTPNRIPVRPAMVPSDIHHDADTHQRTQSTPSEPIIRVNIGRVEVRAAAPPPALQQADKPARLSLDDYLRSRSKGRR
jgi:hypothetical protein